MMERDDIFTLSERIFRDVVANPPEDPGAYLVRVTSGTSGGAPLTLVTNYPREAPTDMMRGGVERVVSCSGSMGARLANALVMRRTPEGIPVRVLPLDPSDLVPGIEALIDDFDPQNIYGFCSYIVRVAGYVKPDTAKRVQRLTFSGEALLPELSEELGRQFPNAEQVEQYMASETAGYIANRFCRHLPLNHFHPAQGVAIDITDCDANGIGDIRVTKSIFRDVRISQYRVGDIGRFVPGVCTCGEAVTIELLGRKGIDYVKLAGAVLRRQEFDRVMKMFPELIADYRVEARQIHEDGIVKGEVTLFIYYPRGAFSADLVREVGTKIARNLFVTPTKTFDELVQNRVFKPLIITFAKEPFPLGNKEVKVRLVAT
jgi:phenylacetate-coenzyme A ligase PaaK-like adenylate-forming protein